MQPGAKQAAGRRVSKLGAMISGIGRYSLACTMTGFEGDNLSVVLNPAIAIPPDKYHGRSVLLNLSLRIDSQWRMLGLRVVLAGINGASLQLRLSSPLAADVAIALQDILVGGPQPSVIAHNSNAPVIAPAKAFESTTTPESVAPLVKAASKSAASSPEQACKNAARQLGVKWQQDILNRVTEKLDQRKSSEKLPQIRRQVRDDLASLGHAQENIVAEFRLKLEDVVSEIFEPVLRISSNESSVDRTLNLMNTARLEDMMSFVDVIRDIETVTHPKMIKLGHCLTRLLAKDVNDENNPLRAERLCELALSTILDNWSGGQTNRQFINDALRESAVSLAAIYSTLTDVLSPNSAAARAAS